MSTLNELRDLEQELAETVKVSMARRGHVTGIVSVMHSMITVLLDHAEAQDKRISELEQEVQHRV